MNFLFFSFLFHLLFSLSRRFDIYRMMLILLCLQESWLAEHAAEDDVANQAILEEPASDPMQGLEGLDVAGPKPE